MGFIAYDSGQKVYVFTSTTAPTSGMVEGSLWYNTTTNVLYSYDGSTWVLVSPSGAWNYIETLTFSGDASKTTTGVITVYDEYLIVVESLLVANNGDDVALRFNADTGNNYGYFSIANVTPTAASAQASAVFGSGGTTMPISACVKINGITPAVANGRIVGAVWQGGNYGVAGYHHGLTINWIGGNATQITSITVLVTATATGTVRVFGRNN